MNKTHFNQNYTNLALFNTKVILQVKCNVSFIKNLRSKSA